jgi:site-specific recombinase XerD
LDKLNLTLTINTQRPDKKGLCPIRIRSCVKGKVKYYSTGICVSKDQFKDREIIKHPNKTTLNAALRFQLVQLEKELIENKMFERERPPDFYSYCETKIKQQKVRDMPGTTRHKESYLKKFKDFKSSLLFSDITPALLFEYEAYCKNIGNKDTTIWGSVKFIKKMVNAALRDGVIKIDPLKAYKVPEYIDPVREYLSEEEIERLEKFTQENKIEKLVKVATWFLFSCYTGLRYEDVKTFSEKKIKNGKIILRTGKTNTDVSIKMHPKLQSIMKRISYDVISNAKMNDYLKVVSAACGFDKNLTFHLARHTFAVYWLNQGGTIEALSKILGHSSIRTTQIYAKVSNTKLDKEVTEVWS